MIPRYRSPFGLLKIISGLLGGSNVSVSRVEEAYADYYGMPYSVLLPSCRAGISWALEISASTPKKVICSAYTCTTVIESILRSGSQLVGIDIAHDSFLSDPASIKSLKYQSIVLSEIYGYTYDLALWELTDSLPTGIRIVDMAMTVPSPHHFQRLNSTDVAVISFGVGKCLYAGWGGMGFTHDRKMVMEIRKLRDKRIAKKTLLLLIKHSLEILFRNIIRDPALYGYYLKISDLQRPVKLERADSTIEDQFNFIKQPPSREWFTPTTFIDRYLMLYNLKCASEYVERRITLANQYRKNLKDVNGLLLPPIFKDALSHYTVRVSHHLRDKLKKCLCDMGIETSTLFFLSSLFNKRDFPNAARAAAEIINLPIDIRMPLSDVDLICDCLLKALKQTNYSKH
jgi:dTDP-4-amino-4,6-dideoxygalactose transaminase